MPRLLARRPGSSPAAAGVGAVIALAIVVLVIKWLAITVAILAVPFGIWWILDRAQHSFPEQRRVSATIDPQPVPTPGPVPARVVPVQRARIEARAAVDAAGRCRWCGSLVAHRDRLSARVMSPREYHRNDIEQAVVVAEIHRESNAPRPHRLSHTRG